jgi:hypothetical protein
VKYTGTELKAPRRSVRGPTPASAMVAAAATRAIPSGHAVAAHPGRPRGFGQWCGGDAGREARGFSISRQNVEGVGPGQRPAHRHIFIAMQPAFAARSSMGCGSLPATEAAVCYIPSLDEFGASGAATQSKGLAPQARSPWPVHPIGGSSRSTSELLSSWTQRQAAGYERGETNRLRKGKA